MTLLFCKSSYYRAGILLWLLMSLAGPMPGTPRVFPATDEPSAPQSRNQTTSRTPQAPIDQTVAEPLSPLSRKQKRDLLKSNFEKLKRDTDELSDLAKALQQELNKSNENILSLDVVDKADKIEKLAKRIKTSVHSY
jgi:hypothetical protein